MYSFTKGEKKKKERKRKNIYKYITYKNCSKSLNYSQQVRIELERKRNKNTEGEPEKVVKRIKEEGESYLSNSNAAYCSAVTSVIIKLPSGNISTTFLVPPAKQNNTQ